MNLVSGHLPSSAEISAFWTETLDTFLCDRDLSEVRAFSSGQLDVVRRGQLERLQASLDDDVFERLSLWERAHSEDKGGVAAKPPFTEAKEGVFAFDLPHASLRWIRDNGEWMLWCQKHPPFDVQMDELTEAGMLTPAQAHAIFSHAAAGGGCIAIGPARHVADRWVVALAKALAAHRWLACGRRGADVPWASSLPTHDEDWLHAHRTQLRCGAEGFFAWGLSLDDFAKLCRARLGCLGIYGVRVASLQQLQECLAAEGCSSDSAASQVCVFAHDAEGNARLVAHHLAADLRGALDAGVPTSGASAAAAPWVTQQKTPLSPLHAREPRVSAAELRTRTAVPHDVSMDDPFDGLPPLEPLPPGPPHGWASDSPDDDPGWELGSGDVSFGKPDAPAPVPGMDRGERDAASRSASEGPHGFDAVMSEVRARPTFTPRAPLPHPLAHKLQTDPFGGLTLEPPEGTGREAGAPPTPHVGSAGGTEEGVGDFPRVGSPGSVTSEK